MTDSFFEIERSLINQGFRLVDYLLLQDVDYIRKVERHFNLPKTGSAKMLLRNYSLKYWTISCYDHLALNKCLILAIKAGLIDEVHKILLKNSGIYNVTRCICAAAFSGNRELLDFFANVDKDGLIYWGSPLSCAARGGNREMVDYIIGKIIDPNNLNWVNGLEGATRVGNKESIKFFLEKLGDGLGVRWGNLARIAARGGHLDLFEFYHKKDVGMSPWGAWNDYIEVATKGDHRELINYFISKLERGFNQKQVFNNCLIYAAHGGHRLLVEQFIKRGADNWNEAITHAAQGGHRDLVDFFIEKMGSPNIETLNIAMHRATQGGHKDLIEYFISLGANDWESAIYIANSHNYPDLSSLYTERLNTKI